MCDCDERQYWSPRVAITASPPPLNILALRVPCATEQQQVRTRINKAVYKCSLVYFPFYGHLDASVFTGT